MKVATIRKKLNSFLGQTAVRDRDVWVWRKGNRMVQLDTLGSVELHEIGSASRFCVPLALPLNIKSFPDFSRLTRDWLDGAWPIGLVGWHQI